MRFGRKDPDEARQRHFMSVTEQLSSWDSYDVMQSCTHCGRSESDCVCVRGSVARESSRRKAPAGEESIVRAQRLLSEISGYCLISLSLEEPRENVLNRGMPATKLSSRF